MAPRSLKGPFFLFLGIVVLAITIGTVYIHYPRYFRKMSKKSYDVLNEKLDLDRKIDSVQKSVSSISHSFMESLNTRERLDIDISSIICTDPVWCNIEMPGHSLFRFEPPDDEVRWKLAQSQAATGEQVLLRQVRDVIKHHLDFLDGDVLFRKYQELSDIFLDHNSDLRELTLKDPASLKIGLKIDPKRPREKTYQWEAWGHNEAVVPRGYNFRDAKRAPIVQIGYNAFSRANHSHWFEGPHLGESHIQLPHLIRRWKEVKDHIDTPYILLHAGNENWGLLSTEFPNRTINWGKCCDNYPEVAQMLESDKLVAFLTNQHHNLTHPKLISLPRGMPTFLTHRQKYLFDTMRVYADTISKDTLMFASNSNWKHRPFVSQCIAAKFVNEKDTHINDYLVGNDKGARMTEVAYYRKIAASRTSICLAGLGYDSFRLWETMTMGTVAVIEKGTGLDKALWRLPALLVEDFDEVTPSLLRTAYVEALYRASAGDFEFERLTQSFWWSFVMNVSTSAGTSAQAAQEAINAKFPPQSEDPTFARPLVPYSCGEDGLLCGFGTKRTPKTSCGGKPAKPKK